MSDALSYIVYGLYGIILNELIWVFRYTLKVTKNEGEKKTKKSKKDRSRSIQSDNLKRIIFIGMRLKILILY